MPVTYITIEWPNNEKDEIYSPSSVIIDFFSIGENININDFLVRCNEGLSEASERVRQKFGFACTSALSESNRISEKCKEFDKNKYVKIIAIN